MGFGGILGGALGHPAGHPFDNGCQRAQCHRLLHLLGWSVGEFACWFPDGTGGWQVDASRDGHTIVARAATQTQAWRLACRMAGRIERGE